MMIPFLAKRPPASALDERRAKRVRKAFAREREKGMRLALMLRFMVFALVPLWLVVSQRHVSVVYYLGICAVFLALGLARFFIFRAGRDRPWHKYAFAAADSVLLTLAVVLPNPLQPEPLPQTLALRGGAFLYFFILLAQTVLSLTPLYVLWTGLVSAAAWSAGVLWIISRPETHPVISIGEFAMLPLPERLARYLDPYFVDIVGWYQEVIVLLLVTAILAVAVWRSQTLARRQAAAERERGNLARYFSPNVVDRIADLDGPIHAVRRQMVAVLFADIVGFSAFAERATPEATIALLRAHYDRLVTIVFEHGGTLDKYIGDCLMVTFGTPDPGADDATRALRCARAMLEAVDAWNEERTARGEEPVRMGIGLEYGPVVLGNIGSERRLEITVIGDAVNVASRLEGLTRTLGVDLVVSADLIAAVRRESGAAAPELAGLYEGAEVELRGRNGHVRIWTLGRGVERRLVAGA